MSQPAARVGDLHVCPMSTGTVPHVGGPVLPPGAATVLVGGAPAARVGDATQCLGALDLVVGGAMTVRAEGRPFARLGDPTGHGGAITAGDATVLVGTAGTSGNTLVGTRVCVAMPAGRNPPPGTLNYDDQPVAAGTPGQSYNNCGVESVRQVLHQTRPELASSQEDLLDWMMDHGLAERVPTNLWASGGTNPQGRAAALTALGVPTTTPAAAAHVLELYVAMGRGVIVSVWAGNLPTWADQGIAPDTGAHALLVTGIEYDAAGRPVAVVVNDTGLGQCGESIPYEAFVHAQIPGRALTVTEAAIW